MKGESGREYVAILDAYRRGDDAALDRLRALWKQGEAVHQEIWQALDRELAPLALVMHCDLAVRAVATSDDETANWHLAVAGRLASLDRFRQPDASVQARLTRRGYYVLSVWLATGRLRLMPVRLRDAFEAFPNDPDLLLARGSYEETFLNPAIPRPDAPPSTVSSSSFRLVNTPAMLLESSRDERDRPLRRRWNHDVRGGGATMTGCGSAFCSTFLATVTLPAGVAATGG